MLTRASSAWLRSLRSYVLFLILFNFLWEILQLPLYTIWTHKNYQEIVYAVLHCTVGDAIIGTFSLVLSLLFAGAETWPYSRFREVAISTIMLGVGYTVFSEWHNTTVTHSWTYTSAMPTLWGIGLAPVAQWIAVPGFSFWWVDRRNRDQNCITR